MSKRAILIVLDSLGIGALPDAADFGDEGSNTLKCILKSMPDINIPNLKKLGLLNIEGLNDIDTNVNTEVSGAYGRMKEASYGKDTITGHWEIAGILTKIQFKTFEKFPSTFMKEFEDAIGVKTLGNYAASGTEIIKDLGPEHEATGKPIVYTSADSVFQIAANTDIIPLEKLYEICQTARDMLVGDMAVGRVIARPYIIENGERVRTSDRKDYSVAPPEKTILDYLKDNNKDVIGIGKINDIFAGQGLTESIHTVSNLDGINKTIEVMKRDFEGLLFTNLVDFDSKFGHRRDPLGYGQALEEFDGKLPHILESMKDEDIIILCADHGNDPCHVGWNHTREYVPLLVTNLALAKSTDNSNGINLETRNTFADIGATICEYFGVKGTNYGESFLRRILCQ